MKNHASYILATYSYLKSLSIEQILQVGMNQAEEIPIPSFDENLLINLCLDAQKIFDSEDVVLKIDGDAIVVGDIHGSFHDLLRILHFIQSNTQKVIFLGDYVDRGSFSLECITILFALKISFPDRYFLLRGNHEFDIMCSQYGFKKEILNYHNPKKMSKVIHYNDNLPSIPDINSIDFEIDSSGKKEEISDEQLCDSYFANHINMNCYKYTEKLYDSFISAFSYLPIAAIVNNTSLCIHGGLSPHLDKVEKIRKLIQKPINDYDENEVLCDLLWGDPSVQLEQFYENNPRGRGHLFNGVVVVNFLKNNNLQRIIRAHQCVKQGFEKTFNEKCITVFSASSYNYDMGNSSGILKIIQKDDKVKYIQFDPIKRLNKYDAIYFKVQAFDDLNDSTLSPHNSHIRSMASCTLGHHRMTHSNSIDNSSIVLSAHEEKGKISSSTSTSHFMMHNMPNCRYSSSGNVMNPFHRKIHHCCSLFPRELHRHLSIHHLNRKKLSIEEIEEFHSDGDENAELPEPPKCLPKLAQKTVY